MTDLEKKIKLQAAQMSPRHVQFAEAYLHTMLGSEAYRAVYGAKKTRAVCDTNGSRLLRHAKVAAYIKLRFEQRKSEQLFDFSFAVNKCLDIVNSDFAGQTHVFTKSGLADLDEKTRKLIQATKIKERIFKNADGKKETEYEYEVTFMSKDKALDMLNKMGGHYLSRVDVTTDGKELKTMSDVARALEAKGVIGNGTSTNSNPK